MNRSCVDPSCENRAVLVLDANSVFFLMRGTARLVEDRYSLPNRQARASQIATELCRNFELVKCCSTDGNVYTSEAVFSEEISLAHPGNAVYKAVPELKGFTWKGQLTEIQIALTSYLWPPLVTDQGQVDALRSFLANHQLYPLDHDCTLILLACIKASDGNRTHLISNDYQVSRSVRFLAERGTVNLSEEVLSLGLLNCLPYQRFFLTSHDKCCLCSGRFMDLCFAYLLAEYERKEEGLKRPDAERRIAMNVGEALRLVRRSIVGKKMAEAC